MNNEQIWVVECTIIVQMAVVAKEPKEAETIAANFLDEELRNTDGGERNFYANPINEIVDEDLIESIPYGSVGVRRDWTVKKWLSNGLRV